MNRQPPSWLFDVAKDTGVVLYTASIYKKVNKCLFYIEKCLSYCNNANKADILTNGSLLDSPVEIPSIDCMIRLSGSLSMYKATNLKVLPCSIGHSYNNTLKFCTVMILFLPVFDRFCKTLVFRKPSTKLLNPL